MLRARTQRQYRQLCKECGGTGWKKATTHPDSGVVKCRHEQLRQSEKPAQPMPLFAAPQDSLQDVIGRTVESYPGVAHEGTQQLTKAPVLTGIHLVKGGR